MKFTKTTMASLMLPPDKNERFEWDDDLPGFGVRLRGGGIRWVVQYRVGSQQRRESLGDVRKVTLEDARKIARNRFAQVELGSDPAAEKAKVRSAQKVKAVTFDLVAKQYLASKKGILSDATYTQATHHLLTLWKPFAGRPINEVGRADVAARLHEIVAECATSKRALRSKEHLRGKTAAARARSNLSAMFGWAMREGLCETNPAINTNDPAEGIEARDRVLTDHELSAVWRSCLDDDFGRIVRLLILTGCRREEIGGLKWSEIDLDAGTINFPGERTKNRNPLSLSLPAVAMDILRTAPIRAGREFVFGERGDSFSAWSYSTIALHSRIAATEGNALPHWTLHDLRRTMRTGMGKLGVAPHVAERVVNHVKGGVESIYDRYDYGKEIKAALAIWADHVIAVVENRTSNITILKRA